MLFLTGKSQALKIAYYHPLEALITNGDLREQDNFLLENVLPSDLSTVLAKTKKCFILSSEVADVFNNLLKGTDDARFSVTTLCQLFSGEKITIDFATQSRLSILAENPFSILGGTQLKPMAFLAQNLAQRSKHILKYIISAQTWISIYVKEK